MLKNKLAKQSYFIKRLRNCGYIVDKIFDQYSDADSRAWTIMINAKTASVFCTCYSHHGEESGVSSSSRAFFELHDGGQFIPTRIKIDTSSIEVIIDKLMKFGISPVNQTLRD